jgi:RNA polymerase sigma factor (sigma-70 family)
MTPLLRQLRQLVEAHAPGGLTDAELLERWVARRDEAAFELLVWRHGPLVLSTCRRLLHRAPDVEDAFQATFLVFVRKASSIRRGASLGGWLYQVAYRVALRARQRAARRERPEERVADVPAPEQADDLLWRDLRPVLDEEVSRLPERYRTAFVLCHLQGKTNTEAAQEIGCPVGTVLSRLAWARRRLRHRLARRGVAPSALALTAALVEGEALAAVPAPLVAVTGKLAAAYAADRAAPSPAVALAEGVVRNMFLNRLKTAAAVALALGILAAGVGWAAHRPSADTPAAPPAGTAVVARPAPASSPAPEAPGKPRNWMEVPSQRDGVLLVIGTEIKKGEAVPPDRIATVKVGGELKKYRRLKVGDKVEVGQLLARVDDRLALDELAIKRQKLIAAMADLRAAETTATEAEQRFAQVTALARTRVVSAEEVRGAKLSWERHKQGVVGKQAGVEVARLEARQAQTIVELYEVRSQVRGTVTAIYKRPGEAVKALEPFIRIQLADERD